jgi:hypothetical protein
MSALIDGLGPNGKLMVIGATFDAIEVTPYSSSREFERFRAGPREHQPIPRTHYASPS